MSASITIGAVWEGGSVFSSVIKAIDTLQSSFLSLNQKTLSLKANTDALDVMDKKILSINEAITNLNSKTVTLKQDKKAKKEGSSNTKSSKELNVEEVKTTGSPKISNIVSEFKNLEIAGIKVADALPVVSNLISEFKKLEISGLKVTDALPVMSNVISNFQDLEIAGVKVADAFPAISNLVSEFKNLEISGLKVTDVLPVMSNVISNFQDLEIAGVKVADAFPAISNLVSEFKNLEIAGIKVIDAFPIVSSLVSEFKDLEIAGVNVTDVLPVMSNITSKFQNLEIAGKKIANTLQNKLSTAIKLINDRMLIATIRTKMLSLSQRISATSSSFMTVNLNKLKTALTLTSLKMTGINVATKLLTATQWLFNAALYANPIGLIIAGVAAGALLIYKYWQPISVFLGGVFDGFMSAIAPLKASLQPLFTLLSPLGNLFSWIGDGVGYVASWFGELLTPVNLAGEELKGFASTGEMIGSVIGTVFTLMLSPITAVIDAIGYLGKLLPEIGSFFGFGDEDNSDNDKDDEKGKTKNNKKNKTAVANFNNETTNTQSSTLLPTIVKNDIGTTIQQVESQSSPRTSAFAPIEKSSATLTKNATYQPAMPQPLTSKAAQVIQNITMYITIQNPASTVDVEQGVSRGIASQGLNLTDGVV